MTADSHNSDPQYVTITQQRLSESIKLDAHFSETKQTTKLTLQENENIIWSEEIGSNDLESLEWWSNDFSRGQTDAILNRDPTLPREDIEDALDTLLNHVFAYLKIKNEPPSRGPTNPSDIEICEPQVVDDTLVVPQERWEELAGSRYSDFIDRSMLSIWADPPGLGKTTNGAHGAANRDRPFTVYLPSHKNCWEFKKDENKPDIDLHLKGVKQPRHDCCMEAKVQDEECENHGKLTDWPRMCPVFELPENHSTRELYESIEQEVGPKEAHKELSLTDEDQHPWHGGRCPWQKQFDELDAAKSIVTVYNYLTIPSVTRQGDNLIDDLPGLLASTEDLKPNDLSQMAETLENDSLSSSQIDPLFEELAQFTRKLSKELIESSPRDLTDLPDPSINTSLEWLERRNTEETDETAEALAWVKHVYYEQLREHEEWEGKPLSINRIFAAAAEAGLPDESVRRAIAAPPAISLCPNCGESTINPKGGIHQCEECDWDEQGGTLTTQIEEPARALAWIDPRADSMTPVLRYREMPRPTDLPDSSTALILDATPVVRLYALLFGLDKDEIVIEGDHPAQLWANVTQIINGQYHRSTIDDDSEYSERLRGRLNRLIELVCERHESVLVVGHQPNRHHYDLPDNAEWLYFHAGRGLDRPDTEAVLVLGSPHPPINDLVRNAHLLTMGRSDVRIGGEEYSTRREDGEFAANQPIYRKYDYQDGQDRGRAIPTKGYSGLVGELFRDARENEIVQLSHRNRPILPHKQPKSIYLATNVPTDLPIDTLASMSELIDPVYQQTNLSEGALDFLDQFCKIFDGLRPREKDRWFREWKESTFANSVSEFHTMIQNFDQAPDVTERTVRNYIEELVDVGLLEDGEYVQREGRVYQGDVATSKRALLILFYNGNFKVDEVRRLSDKIDAADGSSGWVEWAINEFGHRLQESQSVTERSGNSTHQED